MEHEYPEGLNITMKKYVLLITCILLLGACASPKKRAAEYMKAGAYDRVAKMYEIALRHSPSDKEAIIGLRNARTKLISKDLIEVRKARNSGMGYANANRVLGLY